MNQENTVYTDVPSWQQFICRACGLIYDEQLGDPDSGLAPGTRFADIPDDWACPLCGVVKADFEPWQPATVAVATASTTVTRSSGKPAAAGTVIIGAGLAGWAVAEAVRALDPEQPILMISACRGDRYHKPELSLAYSRKASASDLVRESAAAAGARLRVRLLPDTFVIGISTRQRQLRTTRGNFRYTSLVLAQGARPALPPELPAHLCWRVNDIDGWNGLAQRLGTTPKRIAIIGAGMVGCELAEDFARAGHQVVLLDSQEQPLSALLPPVAAQRLRANLERIGVAFLGGVKVQGLHLLADQTKRLALEQHTALEVHEVIAATGLKTESRLARSASLHFDRGIQVDPLSLQSSVEHIYALGDCISIGGQPCRFIEPIAQQAQAIAHAILQREHGGYRHRPPVIRLKTRTEAVVVHGLPDPALSWRVTHDSADGLELQQWHHDRQLARVQIGKLSRAC